MSKTETEENEEITNAFSEENMFSTESFEKEFMEEEDGSIEGFHDFSEDSIEEDTSKEDEKETNDEDSGDSDNESSDSEENDDEFNFEDKEDEESSTDDGLDLEAFNKKFDKDFKSEKELADFLKGEDSADEKSKEEEEYEEAEKLLGFYNPYVEVKDGKYTMSDEDIVTKLFQSEALKEGKDLSNEDVQIDIQDQVEDLKSRGVLEFKAKDLRRDLQDLVNKNLGVKQKIDNKREQARITTEKEKREEMQNTFAKFHSTNFYGVELEKKKIGEVYKDVQSGKFLEKLQADPKAIAELALMAAHKDIIFKKSTGLTYNDGIESILADYKASGKKADSLIVNAQKRGTSGSSAGSKSLIDSILFEKPKDE